MEIKIIIKKIFDGQKKIKNTHTIFGRDSINCFIFLLFKMFKSQNAAAYIIFFKSSGNVWTTLLARKKYAGNDIINIFFFAKQTQFCCCAYILWYFYVKRRVNKNQHGSVRHDFNPKM